MGFTNYQSYKIRAVAFIYLDGRAHELEITGGSMTYALNSIPHGSLSAALGRNAITGDAANLYTILDGMTVMVPVEVWLEVIQGPNSIGFQFESWPQGLFKVFSGLCTTTGDSLSREGAAFTINVVGWPADLNFSSCLSRQTHVLTPQMLANAAAFDAGTGVAFSAESSTAEFFTPLNVQTDVWGRALGPWLLKLCENDLLSDDDDPAIAQPGSNFEAAAALNRFEPFVYRGVYKYGKPLAIPLAGLPGVESVATAIAEDVATETYASMGSTTIWDKLTGGFAADYRFAIAPLVDTALVVPFTPGYRQPWQTVWGQEYAAISVEDQKPRPIKGVRLFTGSASLTGAVGLRLGEAADEATTGGRYDNPDHAGGMIIHMNAPRWSANAAAPAAWGADALAAFGVRGGGIFPGAGAIHPLPGPALVRGGAKDLWDAYARTVYIVEALRGRTGSLQGKLRFDVCPGSTIAVQAVRDKFVNRLAGLADRAWLYAEVMAVSFAFDAETRSASTTFALMNIRNVKENGQDATSILEHPLYEDQWNGAPLVENDVFLPQNSQTFQVFSNLP